MSRARVDDIKRLMRNVSGRVQGPVRGRVLGPGDLPGTAIVEVLDADGEVDPNWAAIPNVELPVLFSTGPGTGSFVKLDPGTPVRLAFYEFDRHRPYVDAVLPSGEVPDLGDAGAGLYAGGAYILFGQQVVIEGAEILVGAGAEKFTLLGEPFLNALVGLLKTHKHGDGTVSPDLAAMDTALAPTLSTKVKVE